MPVSTRSQFVTQEQTDSNPERRTRTGPKSDQKESCRSNLPLRNPHHGLKEKMKALTLLYEQQKKASSALRNHSPKPEENRFTTHPSVELISSCRKEEKESKDSNPLDNIMKENKIPARPLNSKVTKTYVLPQPPAQNEDAKENLVMDATMTTTDRIFGFPSSAKMPSANKPTAVARKLSMGGLADPNAQESEKTETGFEKIPASESRILVFVRLRPMSKKEKEGGSRCCVRIVNRRDVYLTEFANENDYLRLKRLRGRHFTFDSSFPDSTSQLEVYSTT